MLKEFLPDIKTNGVYHGYSIAWGVEISNIVNIKAVYYKYAKKPEINYTLPIYQFSFNYSINFEGINYYPMSNEALKTVRNTLPKLMLGVKADVKMPEAGVIKQKSSIIGKALGHE